MSEVEPKFKIEITCPCDHAECPRLGRPQLRKYTMASTSVAVHAGVAKGRRTRAGGNTGQRNSARHSGVTKIGSFFAGHEEHYTG
jgi:hypothetical protein